MLQFKTYNLTQNITLNNDVLSSYINSFWSDVFTPINTSNSNVHLMLMCKVEFNTSELGYRTLGDLRIVNFTDKDLYIDYLINRLGYLTEAYTVHPINKVIFSYILNDGAADDNRLLLQESKYEVSTHVFNNLSLLFLFI